MSNFNVVPMETLGVTANGKTTRSPLMRACLDMPIGSALEAPLDGRSVEYRQNSICVILSRHNKKHRSEYVLKTRRVNGKLWIVKFPPLPENGGSSASQEEVAGE